MIICETMKYRLFKTTLLLFFFLISFFGYTQDLNSDSTLENTQEEEFTIPKVILQFNRFTKKEILKSLYDGYHIDSLEKIIWKPYPLENIPVSNDGYCHTNIDSITYFTEDSIEYVLILLRTVIDGPLSMADRAGIGIALYKKMLNNWELVGFKRDLMINGPSGILPTFKIIDFVNFQDWKPKVIVFHEDELKDSDVFDYFYSLDDHLFGSDVLTICHFKNNVSQNTFTFGTYKILESKSESDNFPIEVNYKTYKNDFDKEKLISTKKYIYQFNNYRWEK